jgi:lipid-binding SYLF domain-containing protein
MIRLLLLRAAWLILLAAPAANAVTPADYTAAIKMFRDAPSSQAYFNNAYGYAVFPRVGKGGWVIGGAFGRGQTYVGSRVTGDTSLGQVSIGFQFGGETFSEIIFFADKAAYDKFTTGKFEFAATAQAVAITAAAQAQTGTTGSSAGAGVSKPAAQSEAVYNNGMAVYVHVKVGLMWEASIGGQKFSFEAK